MRAKIGFVPQKAVLFSGTISENVRYGKEDASEEEVRHAAEVAQASEFIAEKIDGFNTVIAQGGTNVSGGQKQRLSIARALVRKPEIYVFDDSFSALDFKTDARLRAALKKETRKSTVFIVSQRVSTVMDANQIIVLDEGHIAGIGTHRALMKTCKVYYEIVSSQLSMEEISEGNRMSQDRKEQRSGGNMGMGGGPMGRGGGWGAMGRPVEKAKDFKGTSKRLLGYFLPQKYRLVILLIAAIIGTVFNIIGPKILRVSDYQTFRRSLGEIPSVAQTSAKLGRRFWLYRDGSADSTWTLHY